MLRSAALLCVVACMLPRTVHADVQKQAVYEGDSLIWRCQLLGETGTYTDGPSYTMHFSVLDLPTSENRSLAICKGDTLLWNCMQLWAAGEYKDTTWYDEFPTMAKIYHRLNLQVVEAIANPVENQTICEGDTLLWRCQKLYEAGTYHDTVKSLLCPSCDSVYYELHLSLKEPTVHPAENITMILGDTLLWRCKMIVCNAVGESVYKDTTYDGSCPDEVYQLNLTVNEFEAEEVELDLEICAADTLLWRCQLLYEAGTYKDTVKSLLYPSCDSVHYELHLSLKEPTVHPAENITMILGDTLLWRCKMIACNAVGEFVYKDTTYAGSCPDEVYQLNLQVDAFVVTEVEESAVVCAGDTLLWRCMALYEAGEYRDTLKSMRYPEYDSVHYVMTLSLATADEIHESATIVVGDTLLWRCLQIPGESDGVEEYRDTVLSVSGCPEKIYILTLTIDKPEAVNVVEEYTICGKDTLLWRCQLLYETGTYHDTLKSLLYPAYDSVHYTLNLTVLKDSVAPVEVKYLAPGESHYWIDGNTYAAAGEYSYQTHYESGCDSILFRLQVVKYDSTALTSCDGDTVLWRCFEACETKIYSDTVREASIFGDGEYVKEVYVLNFTFHGEPVDSVKDEIATAIPYLWRGQSLTENGTYHDTVYTVPGDNSSCIDSLFTLNLKIELAKDSLEKVTLCNGDTLLWRCQQVYATGEYTDTLFYEPSGNDSIRFTLNLTVLKDSVAPVEVKYLAPGYSYEWKDGNTYAAAGEYSYQTHYESGCDSILFRLQVVKYDSTALTSCDGDTVLWRCFEACETKIYSDTVREASIFGDGEYVKEVYVLNFTFHGEPVDSVKDEIATAIPYLWRGQSLTENGTYRDTVYTVPGDNSSCIDSLFTLNLKIELAKDSLEEVTLCNGDTLLWRCQQVYATGEYTDALFYEPSGNDSIRFTLKLTVNMDSVAPLLVDTLVPGESVPWFAEDGSLATYQEAGEHLYQSQYESGCDSVLHRLRIVLFDSIFVSNCNGETYEWRERVFDRDTIVRDTVRALSIFEPYEEYDKEYYILNFDFHAAAVDSVLNDTISNEALPYLWRGEERWGASLSVDTTYIDNHYYPDESECIDTVFTLNLHVDVVDSVVLADTLCRGDTLLWRCQQIYESGSYYDTLRYPSGNDSLRYVLRVVVQKDSVAELEQVILCNGDSLLWYDPLTEAKTTYLKTSGHYTCQTHYEPTMYQKALGQDGCDSVFHELVLIVRTMKDTTMNDTICYDPENPTYTWRSWRDTTCQIPTTDIESKWYTFTDSVRYAGTTDCDSVRYTMNVFVRRTEGRNFYTTDSLCASDGNVPTEYEWTIAEDGNRVKHIVLTAEERARHGKFIVERKDTVRYLPTSKGYECDSAYYTLNLYIFRPMINPNDPEKLDTLVTDTTLCYSDEMEWYGQTYNADGTYFHTIKYANTDCDSITCRLQLHYYTRPTDTTTISLLRCKGEQEEKIGNVVIQTDESRTYLDSTYYPNTQCVNSYTKYVVTVLEKEADRDTTVVMCHGGSYYWELSGEEYTAPGTYSTTIPYTRRSSCDSVTVNLHLEEIVLDSVFDEPQYICNGESYTWPRTGLTYDQTGIYRSEIVKSQGGCDSVYYILILDQQPPKQYLDTTVYICGSTGEFTWDFNGKTYSVSGEYKDTLRSPQGCDLVAATLHLKMQPLTVGVDTTVTIYTDQTFTWYRNGETYSTAGTYEYVPKYTVSDCDSIIHTLTLIVKDVQTVDATKYDTVCAGTVYDSDHVINAYTEWSVTDEITRPDGVRVDSITHFYIEVFDESFPQDLFSAVVASCGLAVNVEAATLMLGEYADNAPKHAAIENITWKYREPNGSWQTIDDYSPALSGNVSSIEVMCEVTTECSTVSEQAVVSVGTRATWETFTEYDLLPVISKYNGTLLMVDIDAVCAKFGWTNGVEIKQEDVEWYERIGAIDNLSHPDPTDPKDMPLQKWGYYLTSMQSGDYYAIIKGKLEAEIGDCGVWARTMVAEVTSPVQLQPNVAHANATVTVTGLTSQATMSIVDIYGNPERTAVAVTGTFVAPASAGTYFVEITDRDGSVYHRTLIVCP